MPIAQPAKIPFAGADDPAEVLLPEPSQDALRLAELEQENRQLRDDLRHLQSALASAVGLLLPYHRRRNGTKPSTHDLSPPLNGRRQVRLSLRKTRPNGGKTVQALYCSIRYVCAEWPKDTANDQANQALPS